MEKLLAVILICLSNVPPEACTEETAADVIQSEVLSQRQCWTEWQQDVSRSALREEIGRTAYVKTLCRPLPPRAERPPGQ